MTGGGPLPPLWRCPSCGRPFANRNQSHACGVGDLDALFARSDPQVRATFDRVVEAARRCGPLDVVPEKTRVALQVRMSFAAFTPRRRWLDGHVVLARALLAERFRLDPPVRGPYFFADLDGTTEDDEARAIEAGEIRAARLDVVGVRG